jgi:AbrB family looped-hinge helix DNA binding protein
MTEKGQITVPVKIRRFLGLNPGKKLNISLKGDDIVIQKPVDIGDIRTLLKAEIKGKGTGKVRTESGAGWTAHVEDRFGKP